MTYMKLLIALFHVTTSNLVLQCDETRHFNASLTLGESGLHFVQMSARVSRNWATQAASLDVGVVSLPSGVSANDVSDGKQLILESVFYIFAALCVPFFLVARGIVPELYTIKGTVKPPRSDVTWATASLTQRVDNVEMTDGLDSAMLLEFTHLSMRVLVTLLVPLLFLCPLYAVFGGGASSDWLSLLDVTNLAEGNWLFWLHVPCVWFVVLVVTYFTYEAQHAFVDRRYRWHQRLPAPRGTSVMVECIPENFRSDDRLYDFFDSLFPGEKVREAHLVKQTDTLGDLHERHATAAGLLREAEAAWGKTGNDPNQRPMVRLRLWDCNPVDSLEHYSAELDELTAALTEQRLRINTESLELGGRNFNTGFVTFHDRREAELAVQMAITPHLGEWLLSIPPDVSDLMWTDLTKSSWRKKVDAFVGYVFLVTIFVAYFPVVLLISSLNKFVYLGVLDSFYETYGTTIGLVLFMALLPPVLLLIFRCFFTLKSGAWSQYELTTWYFGFLFVYVLCVTAIGTSIIKSAAMLVETPYALTTLLASTLPKSSHYYMEYLILQCLLHCLELTQFISLLKYCFWRIFYARDKAVEVSRNRPERCNEIGQRTAKLSLNMCIALVFSTVAPLILIFALIDIVVTRVVYGYLVAFAEASGPDLGGVFWATQLRQLQLGLATYVLLEIGILAAGCESKFAWVSVLPAMFLILQVFNDLHSRYLWAKLPFDKTVSEITSGRQRYLQPELL